MSEKKIVCIGCGKKVSEVCNDGYCKACHISISWEDCITGTACARRVLDCTPNNMKEHAKRWLKELYPNAEV